MRLFYISVTFALLAMAPVSAADPQADIATAKARAALALSSSPAKADPCAGACSLVCQGACDCASAVKSSGYEWVQYSPPDPHCVSLRKNGVQVGAYSFLTQKYRPLNADGFWGAWQALPPCFLPTQFLDKWEETCRKSKRGNSTQAATQDTASVTYTYSQGPVTYSTGAACASGMCGQSQYAPAQGQSYFVGEAAGGCSNGSCGASSGRGFFRRR